MSDDLISRKELLRKFSITDDGRLIHEYDCDNFPTTINLCYVKTIIRNMPTAFDKENVIEEIREEVSDCYLEYCGKYNNCLQCRADEAVKIVEKGGIE